MSNNTRQSPIAHALANVPAQIAPTLSHPTDLVSIGVRVPSLAAWAAKVGLEIPANLYDVANLGERGLIIRVGSEEITLDCRETDPILARIEASLSPPTAGLYRIEQQPAIFELRGDKAIRVFAQTCGVDPTIQPANRIFFTRVAGVSCGIVVFEDATGRTYRIRVDYTLAPYLWETLIEIVREL